MIQKKICLLGSFGVGKTSLVARYVHSIFSERYHSTVGVKIDKKEVEVNGKLLNLVIWDVFGEDQNQKIQSLYLRGSSGYFLVADCTRPETLDVALSIHVRAQETLGPVPFLLIINKSDLDSSLDQSKIDQLSERGWTIIYSSAKNGAGVEEAFATLASQIFAKHNS